MGKYKPTPGKRGKRGGTSFSVEVSGWAIVAVVAIVVVALALRRWNII